MLLHTLRGLKQALSFVLLRRLAGLGGLQLYLLEQLDQPYLAQSQVLLLVCFSGFKDARRAILLRRLETGPVKDVLQKRAA